MCLALQTGNALLNSHQTQSSAALRGIKTHAIVLNAQLPSGMDGLQTDLRLRGVGMARNIDQRFLHNTVQTDLGVVAQIVVLRALQIDMADQTELTLPGLAQCSKRLSIWRVS